MGVWAPGSTFPLQEDVAYSISAEMFRTFLIPHIRAQIAAMDYPFFHVDGTGMIPYVDALLEIAPPRDWSKTHAGGPRTLSREDVAGM